ncbi:MAG: histidinol dehydrogenase [Halobacteriota archaeon]
METEILRVLDPAEVERLDRAPIDEEIVPDARRIVMAVRSGGDDALLDFAIEHDGLDADDPLVLESNAIAEAAGSIPDDAYHALERAAERVVTSANAQIDRLDALETAIPGGRSGHHIEPLHRAGCYAPGGGYPLPSSVLMTAIPARVAGVEELVVASPDPDPVTLAAADICHVDMVVTAGGAHAMGALGFGTESVPRCDVVVGPGGPWVTAGKKAITGYVRTDFMAGPTELVIVADGSADPSLIAADLIAQAEHAPEAWPVLLTPSASLIRAADREIVAQLADLPTAAVARRAFERGFAVLVEDLGSGIDLCESLAPEHVQLAGERAIHHRDRLTRYGTLFVGQQTPEAFGDYGLGPNHVLPTGGAARFTGGLSVFDFLRMPTWLELTAEPLEPAIAENVTTIARLEGLEGHARSVERRLEDRDG